jgi:GNAT superfamily N-acetyltransferase
MNITKLRSDEVKLLFPIGHAFTAEASRAAFNEEVFEGTWSNLIKLGLGEIYVASDDKGAVVAVLGAAFLRDPFSGQLTATEAFWYVVSEHRKSGVGLRLLDVFEDRAKELKCEQILMVHFVHVGGEVLQKLYERRGYALLEQTFRKKI